MYPITSQCLICRHFDDDNNRNHCKAFPDGIPSIIFAGIDDHSRPFPGDNGIQFEPLDEYVGFLEGR